MKNHSDCEGSLLVKDWDNFVEPPNKIFHYYWVTLSPILMVTQIMRGCTVLYHYVASGGAEWARDS